MDRIRLTKEFSFEVAHFLEGYRGLCSRIHGHSYRLLVTVIGSPSCEREDPNCGMVLDFSLLKSIVNRVVVDPHDHSLVMREGADGELRDALLKNFDRIIEIDCQPTCENMACRFARIISNELPDNVSLVSVRLYETATSYAEWVAEDNQ